MDRVFDLYSRQLVLTVHDRKLSLVSEKLARVRSLDSLLVV